MSTCRHVTMKVLVNVLDHRICTIPMLGTAHKRMRKALQIRIAKLGWLAALIGTLMVAFAAAILWLLLALKDFSSAVRDTYETPPGVVHYIFLGMVCLGLLLIFVAGVVMVVLGLIRRSRDA